MHVGSELRRARFAKGLSREQLSAHTKISAARLEAIERNRVDELPPLVYLRGYLRAYAREVGLDPDDITDRYIAQFESASPAAADDGAAADPTPRPLTPPAEPPEDRRVPTHEHRSHFDRAHSDLPLPTAGAASPRPARRTRSLELLVGAIALIALAIMATQMGRRFEPVVSDSGVAPPTVDATRATAERDTPELPPPAATVDEAEERRADAARATAADDRNAPAGESAAIANVAGSWTFSNEVVSSSVATFRGLRLDYRVDLEQQGTEITGRGVKSAENGRTLARSARTPIDLSGTVEGNRVRLTFRERGRRRTSEGTFELTIVGDDTMRGTFHSDAAKSTGRSVAARAQQ